jgi:hypothetical protein
MPEWGGGAEGGGPHYGREAGRGSGDACVPGCHLCVAAPTAAQSPRRWPVAPSRSLRTQPAPHRVVRAYLEFVERRPLPAHAGLPPEALAEAQRRDGFEASSADNIFASTTLAARAM